MGRLKNAARNFESFGTADPNDPDSGHTERSCYSGYSILVKHSRALPLYIIPILNQSAIFVGVVVGFLNV
jgi:hypothetical protein